MKSKIILLAAFCFLVIACEEQKDNGEPKQINVTKTTEQVIAADNLFGIDLFKRVLVNDPTTDNIFISPTSVALALAMTYNGADGTTKSAMAETLRKQELTTEQLNQTYKDLINALVTVDPKVLLEIANSIWYREDIPVLSDFVTVNQTYYNAEVNALIFDNLALEIINGWVADKTHDKIQEVLDFIPPDAVMYLINAIYFKGIWRSEFDKDKTTDMPFYLKDGSVIQVPTMQQQDTFRYFHNDLLSAVELPYGDGNFSMAILLPENNKTTDDVVSALSIENWDAWMKEFSARDVVMHLPRLKYEYNRLLNQDLIDMGMGIAFTWDADFSGIDTTRGLCISRVIHKTFVEVNEEGTEAAAVTVVEIIETSIPGGNPGPVYFFVDRPFLFVIKEKDTGAILFIGRVNNPLKN
ncbi:MAG: serpin family protein [Bacteroidales bacterium]|nr:serpin family protein [Bacteroidales bacterium]